MPSPRLARGANVLAALALAAALAAPRESLASTVGCAVVLLDAFATSAKTSHAAETALEQAVMGTGPEGCPGGPVPVAGNLAFTPNPNNALSGTLAFQTDAPATPSVKVLDPEGDWTVPASGILSDAPGTTHRIAVLGLRAETTFRFEASAVNAVGNATLVGTPEYAPPPLPADFPPIAATDLQPDKIAPGVTFFSMLRESGDALADIAWGYILAVDAQGRVVWHHRAGPEVNDFRRLPNGNLLYLTFDPLTKESAATEIDLLGNQVRRWTNKGLEQANPGRKVDNFHHDVEPLPSGNFLVLSTELRSVGGFPEDQPHCPGGVCNVVGDKIVEFTPEGEIVGEWSLFDALDPRRRTDDFDLRFWDILYGVKTKDWTHANAAVYDPQDDTMIVSARNQDLVFKMTRENPPRLVWALGANSDTTDGDDAWPFLQPDFSNPANAGGYYPSRQHAPEILPSGNLLLYDNGNSRGITSVVEYAIHEGTGLVDFAWNWVDPAYEKPLQAPFVGDADRLSNGNILETDGALPLDPDAATSRSWTRIVEIERDSKEKVWELQVRDGRPSGAFGWGAYRAERMSLYPPSE